jgi:hypothetical protein
LIFGDRFLPSHKGNFHAQGHKGNHSLLGVAPGT